MSPQWQPGTQYNYDDSVEYQGAHYKIIQPHRSQSDWTPPATPALWGRMSDGDCREKYQSGADCRTTSYNPGYGQQSQHPMHQRQEGDRPSNNVPVVQPSTQEQEEEKRHHGMDESTKKKLEIGGGLLAGAAVIGAGIFAYNHHNQKEEEKRGESWASDFHQREALERTQQYRSGQYQGPVAWILNEGKNMPRDAIQGGEERGERLYICRAYHKGGLMVGKACRVFKKGAVIGYAHEEIHVEKYEILVGNGQAVRWVPVRGRLNLSTLGARPVEGGKEPSGEPQYIAQAPYHGAVHPGKVCESFKNGCFIPYDNSEKEVKDYAVLCYA